MTRRHGPFSPLSPTPPSHPPLNTPTAPCPAPAGAFSRSPETLRAFLDLLSYRVSLADLFDIQTVGGGGGGGGGPTLGTPTAHSHSDHGHAPSAAQPLDAFGPSYVFRGFVGYYGLHYISVFQDRTSAGDARPYLALSSPI